MDFNPQPIKTQNSETPSLLSEIPPKPFYQANKFYVWATVLALVVIGVLGYFALRPLPQTQVKEANVQIDIQAPEALPSGSEAVYRITVRNNDSSKISQMEMELTYPDEFIFVQSSPKPENLSGSVFKIPDLQPSQNAAVIIKLKTAGDINAEKKLTARLRYKYSNFNSSFVKENFWTLRLTASSVVLELEGPKETNAAQLVAFSINYKNESADTLKNARIKMNYPTGFKFGSSQPPVSLADNIWNIGDLQSKSEGRISFQGTFDSSQPGETKQLQVELLVLGNNGEYFVQNTAQIATAIISQPLFAALENLDGNDKQTVNPGDSINFSVRYQNNSPVVARGVNIAVSLDSKALDLTTLQAQGGQLVGNTITWNASGVPDLENLNSGSQGTLNFFVRVKNPATKDSSKNLAVNISAKIKSNEYSTFLPGGSIELKISSPSQIQSELLYLSGSLPPKVGTQTKYKAIIRLSNSSNDFSSLELSVFLPTVLGTFSQSGVNAAERENAQFDPATGKLTWKAGVLPAHTGKFSPAKTLEFELSLNPSPSDAGASPTLLRNIRFTAKDNFTGENVEIRTEDLTSASLSGQDGYYNGIVSP